MRKESEGKAFFCLVVAFLLILPITAHAEKQKIRVIVENASIRMKPDIQSEAIKSPPLGSLFDVERKVGEWYEIRFPTEVGVLVTGYIHEMFVEVEKEEKEQPEPEKEAPKKPERKTPPSPPPSPKKGPPPIPQKTPAPRAELAIRGAYTTGYSVNSQSYSDSFSAGLLKSATTAGDVTQELEKPLGFSGSFNYFLAGGLGIQLRLDYNLKSNFTDASKSTFKMNWSWTTGGSSSEEAEWPVVGDVTLMIISGNLIYKLRGAGMIAPFFSGGASYYSGKLKANTTGGYGTTWFSSPYRYIDYFKIPADLDTSFSGIGFNVGGGLDILFSRNIGLTIDARYFLLKKVEDNWEIQGGEYSSNLNEGWTLTLSEDSTKLLQEEIGLFELDTSFFKASAGIKLMF